MNDFQKQFEAYLPDTIERAPNGYYRVRDMPTADELREYYALQYYQKGLGSYSVSYSEFDLEAMNSKMRVRWHVIEEHFKGSGTLLDVGCGEGFLLAHAKSQNWDVKGIDFSAAGIEAQNPGVAENFVAGDVFELLEQEKAAGNRYDVLWLQNVLEHVTDPEGLMATLHQLVSENGLLVVTVPNDFSGLQLEALRTGAITKPFWVALPDHLSYFTSESLDVLASQKGWDTLKTLADFPIDWFLMNPNSNYVNDREKGAGAHSARLAIETSICSGDKSSAVAVFEALAGVGMGRNITKFLKPMQ